MIANRTRTAAAALLAAALWAAPALAQQVAPSDAVKLALQAAPGAEALGVKLDGDHYVVRLKQDGAVIQVLVDATTGAVSQ
ncbi:MAG: PepSY domain-containing protein [Aestuariivirga sp.]|uniref:PepSY domain-containing protein n=1 Tax=Aestuariivirga sp. TaxID=2650926 RepID=UPI0025BEFD34|nr:PepSY domain-containing protein [Aestuariivirga sp.]MCA3561482.1 PepSY domain-containing protein [Aestuariivirga sp.]